MTLLWTDVTRINGASLPLVEAEHALHLAQHLPAPHVLLDLAGAFVASQFHLEKY
jgi:hypothetical protein